MCCVRARSRGHGPTGRGIVERAPERWGREMATNLDGVKEALSRFIALISVARRPGGDGQGSRPLFQVEVQLWVREVSRLLRTVESVPRFRWADSGGTDDDGDEAVDDRAELSAIYCRLCGRTGWMDIAGELDGTLVIEHASLARGAAARQPQCSSTQGDGLPDVDRHRLCELNEPPRARQQSPGVRLPPRRRGRPRYSPRPHCG